MTESVSLAEGRAAPVSRPAPRSYLYHPVVDFLCLGGGSLFILFPLLMVVDDGLRPGVVLATFFAAQVINQPHFAHSYQIFYHRFREKLTGTDYPPLLRSRYAFAGIVVPASMIAFFMVCYLLEDPVLLGWAGNLLALTVGWHYVKQGYGILMVECVLKRSFFTEREKNRLKLNAYVVWLFFWVYANHFFRAKDYKGLTIYSFDLPDWLLTVMMVLAVGSTLSVLLTIAAKAVGNGGRLAYNGLLAYFVSIYIWLYAINTDPLLLLIVPVFHSIQYMAVVWRYQLNRARAKVGDDRVSLGVPSLQTTLPAHVARLLRFILIGGILSFAGFHAAPYLLTASASDALVFGPTTFIIMVFIFFNVHHFFLDNVMWRKENPEIKQHLFTPA